ncbi:MAG: FkbM family methyltransferase [Anaerolineae bacterium]|nr:FkbM family methyltransferase [Anaerolineae bacterium]
MMPGPPAEFPQQIRVSDLTAERLVFKVHYPIESWRIVDRALEFEQITRLLELLKADDVFYDIGANVRLYTIPAATLLPKGQVIAFEPDAEFAAHLQENVALNHLPNVVVKEWAITDYDGAVTLYSDGAAGFSPTLREQKNRENAPHGVFNVPARSLDLALAAGDLPLPTVIKIDIEGAEGLCLRGAQRLLTGAFGAQPRLILLELHPEFLGAFGMEGAEIKALFQEWQYTVAWSDVRASQEHIGYTFRGI